MDTKAGIKALVSQLNQPAIKEYVQQQLKASVDQYLRTQPLLSREAVIKMVLGKYQFDVQYQQFVVEMEAQLETFVAQNQRLLMGGVKSKQEKAVPMFTEQVKEVFEEAFVKKLSPASRVWAEEGFSLDVRPFVDRRRACYQAQVSPTARNLIRIFIQLHQDLRPFMARTDAARGGFKGPPI
jgi:hypothetical protein